MATCGHPTASLALLLGVAVAATAAHAAPGTPQHSQAVLLVSGQSILQRKLPAFLSLQGGRFIAASAVQSACQRPGLKDASLLLYLPDSGTCESIVAQNKLLLRQRLYALSGRQPGRDLQDGLREQPYIAIQPLLDSGLRRASSCSCPGNTPPTGSVLCDAQTRTAGDPIGTVVFLANDADGDTLTGTFSYQHDTDPVQPGLPAPLSSSCQQGTGTLQCSVDGSAPTQPGILALNLLVSDGSDDLHLDSLLEVLAPVPDRLFADGFEPPSCP